MSLTHALPYDYDVVTRRVNQRAASLRNALLAHALLRRVVVHRRAVRDER